MKKFLPLIILIFSFACTEEKIQPLIDKTSVHGEIPSNESWNSKIMFTENGNVKAVLYTDHLKKYEIQRITLLDVVKIDFYDKTQKKTSQLTSLKGRVDDVLHDMYAIQNVVAQNDSGVVLKTEELKWRNSDQKIVTDKFVSITTRKEIIEGYGLEADQDLNNYIVFNPTYTASVARDQNKK